MCLHVVLEVAQNTSGLRQNLPCVRIHLILILGAISLHSVALLRAQVVRQFRLIRVGVCFGLIVDQDGLRHLLAQEALLLHSELVSLDLSFFLLDLQLDSLLLNLILQVLVELIALF